jgi:hypothetical protein
MPFEISCRCVHIDIDHCSPGASSSDGHNLLGVIGPCEVIDGSIEQTRVLPFDDPVFLGI